MKLAVGFILYGDTTARYLADFLPSLERALSSLSLSDLGVYIYDNSADGDQSNRQVVDKWLAASGRSAFYRGDGYNLGFSRAYNILIRQAILDQAEYFLIINPDTKINPEAVSHLISALDKDKSLASVSPKILRWDRSGLDVNTYIDSLGLELKPGLRFVDRGQGQEDGKYPLATSILGPSGAAGLFRLSALASIAIGVDKQQYFDERFFMYKEDCDLAYRLFLAGHKSQLVPRAIIYHDRSAANIGSGILSILRGRAAKSRQIRSWSFFGQHLIYLKYWSNQVIKGKIYIIIRAASYLIFSLILERFLLKEYFRAWKAY